MRPHVTCHMLSSIDGSIDSKTLSAVTSSKDYEPTHAKLNGDAWMCGRVTLQKDFAEYMEAAPFDAKSGARAGARRPHVAAKAGSYAVAVDTHGVMQWKSGDLSGDHLIAVVTEQASSDYLSLLEERGVSYVVAGKEYVDFAAALEVLGDTFGIKTLLLEGGGHLNGALMGTGLVDEVSLLLTPAVDVRSSPPASYDGQPDGVAAKGLRLKSVERLAEDVLWLRYDVKK